MALPFLLLFSFKSKYRHSLPARFFLRKNRPFKAEGIWFHSCSFGEAKALNSLVTELPEALLRMTTTTQTGFHAIKAYTKEARYLPFEPLLFFWMKPQKVLVVMEAEFWYLLFALAKKRGAKTLLINARMSDSSFPKYQKIAWLYRQIFNFIDEVYAQTPLDKERLESLGAKNVQVTGNIKLSSLPQPTKYLEKPEGMVVCGASTHEGEEALILSAYGALRKQEKKVTLLLVPRHPERFESVMAMAENFANAEGVTLQRYSHKQEIESDIVVVDLLGELVNMYAISNLVILGGSFVPVGGHNGAEAAQFGCKIISGKYYFNQRDIFSAIEGIAIVEASTLTKRVLQHAVLKPTKLITHTDITPILESIQATL